MESNIRKLISIAVSILVAYLAITFLIWLLPILFIIWVAYYIYSKLTVKSNIRKANGKIIIETKKGEGDIYE